MTVPAGNPAPASARYPVPAIAGRPTRRFAPAVALTLLLWALAWPLLTFAFVNRYDAPEVGFIHGLFQRKDVILTRPTTAPADASPASSPAGGRLVVLGGSNALFGVDAELIETRLGVPTVNAATHGGVGVYALGHARAGLRPGDSVLLCPEYEMWRLPPTDLSDLEWEYFTSWDRRYLFSLGPRALLPLLYSQGGQAWGRAAIGWRYRLTGRSDHLYGPYNVAMLDSRGDLREEVRPAPVDVPPALRFVDPAAPNTGVGEFRDFARWAADNRVRVFYSWPNVCRPAGNAVTPTPAGMKALLAELGFVVLNEPAEACFPREWFRDTRYHADAGCRRVRTEALIRRLRPYFGLPAEPEPPPPQRAAGVYLVNGAGAGRLWPGNTFAGRSGVRAMYLTPDPQGCPDAIAPSDLPAVAAAGVPIWFDEPAVAAALPAGRWGREEADRERASLPAWLAKYDHHLFLLGRAGPGSSRKPLPPDTPLGPEVAAAVNGPGSLVACVGTGRWRGVRRVVRGAGPFVLEARSTALAGPVGPPVALIARADPDGLAGPALGAGPEPQSRVQVNGKPVAIARGDEIAVVVIDPELGIAEDYGTFEGGEEKKVRVLWALTRDFLPLPCAQTMSAKVCSIRRK